MQRADAAWAGDVVVVGAGASGVLTARELARRGLEVTLVEQAGHGAEQSSHSHGLLHRGHIYLNPSRELVAELSRGADAWHAELARVGVSPIAREARVGFLNPFSERFAGSCWRSAGLTFRRTTAPAGFRSRHFSSWYATEEATFDLTAWLHAVVQGELTDVRKIRASAERLIQRGANVAGVEVVRRRGERLRLLAGATVLVAGVGNERLVATATRVGERLVDRMSFMAVLAGRQLPRESVIVPDHEAYGLFVAFRPTEAGTVWLASNYVSYARHSSSSQAATLWLRGLGRTIDRLTNVLDDPSLQWGFYPAPKAEANLGGPLYRHVLQTFGLPGLYVGTPIKLTLAPLLAADIAGRIISSPLERRPRGLAELGLRDELRVLPERWRRVPLNPIDDLLELVRGRRAKRPSRARLRARPLADSELRR